MIINVSEKQLTEGVEVKEVKEVKENETEVENTEIEGGKE